MVNVEKHKRKAIEHDFNKFIDTISGNRRRKRGTGGYTGSPDRCAETD